MATILVTDEQAKALATAFVRLFKEHGRDWQADLVVGQDLQGRPHYFSMDTYKKAELANIAHLVRPIEMLILTEEQLKIPR